MEVKLKPCPFCGAESVVTGDALGCWFVICLSFHCVVMPHTIYMKTYKEAVEAWNTRAGEISE